MSNTPIIIYCDNTDKELYKKLQDSYTYFSKVSNTELFIFAASLGVKYNMREKIKNRDSYTRTEYLKDDDWAIIKSLAISIESVEILNDLNKAIEIIEEFAHGGIMRISDSLDDNKFGSFDKRFELDFAKNDISLLIDPL